MTAANRKIANFLEPLAKPQRSFFHALHAGQQCLMIQYRPIPVREFYYTQLLPPEKRALGARDQKLRIPFIEPILNELPERG